jgi:hypothetical protein
MGEGRLQCGLIDAATLLLARSALAAARRSPGSGGARGAPLKVALICAVLVACNRGLQALGLIDRSGQDPHDKTEPTEDLLGPTGEALRAQHLAATLGPLVAGWLLWAGAARWLRVREREQPAGGGAAATTVGVLAALGCAAAALQHVAIACFWWATLHSAGGVTGEDALAAALAWGRAHFGPSVVDAALLPEWSPELLAAAEPWLQLPLRLLLPRAVYVLALLPLGAAAALGTAGAVVRTRGVKAAAEAGGGDGAALGARATLWVVASAAGPVVMLWGYKGPAIMALGLCQALCLVSLLSLRQRARLAGSSGAHSSAAGSSPLPALSALVEWPASSTPSGGEGGSGVAPPDDFVPSTAHFFGAYGLQLFFCSGHFCEFSGLQYSSSFVGFDDMEALVSGPLLLVNTFGGLMLACLALPAAAAAGRLGAGRTRSGAGRNVGDGGGGGGGVWAEPGRLLSGALLWVSGARALALCVCIASAAVQQGHILLWAIFAPKLVFEMWLCAVADAFLLLGALVAPGW